MASFSWPGFGALQARLEGLAHPDPTPMLLEWEGVIREDNRRGVLAGIDKDDQPMIPVTYRPKPPGPKKPTKAQKNNSPRGIFAGLGPHAAGLNNNLTPAEYRLLGGPPLAPRGKNSRVITNLVTEHTVAPDAEGEWFAVGYWDEVVSVKGVPFLGAHFEGYGRLPQRDLRGVRQWGRREAFRAMQRWGATLLKGLG